MCSRKKWWILALILPLASVAAAQKNGPQIGRTPMPSEVALWNIDVLPDGTGLPVGRGTVSQGEVLYTANCLACHGASGEGGIKDRLAGGRGSLGTAMPVKTVGSYWPYATTLYDYIRRAMPYQAPASLSDDDYYALSAYLLYVNGIVPSDASLDQSNLYKVRMPNRDGFTPEPEFRRITNSRQKPRAAK